MLNLLQFAGTQTEFKTSEFKHLPKLTPNEKRDSNRRSSMKPYYYNETGKICSNPLPAMIGSSTYPSSPLKYRPLGIKFDESEESSSRIQKKTIRASLSPTTIKLRTSLNSKEIYVMEDDIDIQQKLEGFSYTITRNVLSRKQKQQEKEKFFEKCRLEFNKNKKYRYIFSIHGKHYQFLQEIPFSDKVIIASTTNDFKGVKDSSSIEEFYSTELSKSLPIQLEDKFSTTISTVYTNNPAEVNFLPNKTFSNFPARLKYNKLTPNELKIKLGQTAVKIDTEFPKIFDMGMDKIKKKCSFFEADIHKLYARFKMLVHLSIAKNPNHSIKLGITREMFIESYRGTPELNFVLGRIFDCIDQDRGGTISWDEYLTAMDIMCNGTYEQQIDLFFQVYDTDQNGSLSFDEIRNLCRLQLPNSDADNVIEELSQSFASLIFDITETNYDKEIPAEKIKSVLTRQTDKSLIEMFCSFSFMKA